MRSSRTALHLQKTALFYCSHSILCDVPTGTPPSFFAEVFNRPVFDAFHNLAQPGIHQNDILTIRLAVHQQGYSAMGMRLLAMLMV